MNIKFDEDIIFSLKNFESNISATIEKILNENIVQRIIKRDYTVWSNSPVEVSNRLAWLDCPFAMDANVEEVNAFVNEVKGKGYTHSLLLGMGGSSLAPEVFRRTFGIREGFIDLEVLDSTDPDIIVEKAKTLDPLKTLYFVSTKSGGTVETLSFAKYFFTFVSDAIGASKKAGDKFVAITDPGSGLEQTANDLSFFKTFLNDPNIGGRYAALSYVGLAPAVLLGIDLNKLLSRARNMADQTVLSEITPESNSPAWLGSVMGSLALKGINKLSLILSSKIESLGKWIEQLVAESTGKNGIGILPVLGEPDMPSDFYRADRTFIYIRLKGNGDKDIFVKHLLNAGKPVIILNLSDIYDIGAEFFRWEFATAVAGAILKVNPFDQPNVESAKVRAKEMMTQYKKDGFLSQPAFSSKNYEISIIGYQDNDSVEKELESLFKSDCDYVSIQAYVTPCESSDKALKKLQKKIFELTGAAVTVGYGPSFLHSTGQLHKGYDGKGVFLQLSGKINTDVQIPDQPGLWDSSISFGVLRNAQMLGDRQALIDSGRSVITIFLENKNTAAGIDYIIENLS